MKDKIMKKLKHDINFIKDNVAEISISLDSIDSNIEAIDALCGLLDLSSLCLVKSKEVLNMEKAEILDSDDFAEKKYPPSLAKEYLNTKLGHIQKYVDYSEQLHYNLSKRIEAYRSALSALKEELKQI